MKRSILLVALTAAVGLAAPAYGDPGDASGGDSKFLSELSAAGLSHRGSERAISAGRAVCQLMDAGFSPMDTVVAVQATNPGFTTASAAQFATISAGAYCPEHI